MFSHYKFVSFVKQLSDFMVYTRGSAEDYDRFAAVTGDPGWSWDRLLPYFFKVQPSSPLTAEFLTLCRTKNGPNQLIITIHGANSTPLYTVPRESTLSA
jgi:choline dehydrogenase-like flavoprotein